MIPNLTFSVLQLAMRNAIESAFNDTTLDDAVGGDEDAKKKVLYNVSDLIAIYSGPDNIGIGIRVLQVMP